MKEFLYKSFDSVILRTPLFPFEKRLVFDFDNPLFDEALYVASPELFEQKNQQKGAYSPHMLRTLYKYWVRASTRSTPFGLFSSWSIGNIGDSDNVEVGEPASVVRHARLDMSLLCRIIRHLQAIPEVAERILYYGNDSIVRVGDQIHFVEYQNKDGYRTYYLQRADYCEELGVIIERAKKGITIQEAVRILCSLDINEQSAQEFVADLIGSQILVGEIEINAIGEDPLARLISILAKREVPSVYYERLSAYDQLLKTTMKAGIDTSLCERLYSELSGEFNKFDRKYMLQVDTCRNLKNACLSTDVIRAVEEAVSFLSKITPRSFPGNIQSFQSKFMERYEEQSVPLLLALDQESGIGYPVDGKYDVNEELINDVPFANSENDAPLQLSQIEIKILRKMFSSNGGILKEVSLDEDVITGKTSNDDRLQAPTISALINIVTNEEGEQRINLLNCGGITASSLIGRIGYMDSEIERFCSSICAYEQESMPSDTVLAEIVHMPQDRTGNVIHRVIRRKGEIHYLSNRNPQEEKSISASDLLLEARSGRLTLRSRISGEKIIPILSNAHNYHSQSLPVYQFLCEYQHYCFKSVGTIDVANILSALKFSPRIVYKNVVLSPRKWIVDLSDFGLEGKKSLDDAKVQEWREKNNIPDEVLICEFDNELYIDFRNDLSRDVFKEQVEHKERLILAELYGTPDGSIHGEGGNYRSEICLSFHTNKENA
jgi:hypothetical protein